MFIACKSGNPPRIASDTSGNRAFLQKLAGWAALRPTPIVRKAIPALSEHDADRRKSIEHAVVAVVACSFQN